MCSLYVLSSLSAIVVLTIALNHCNKHCPKDGYCSCHGVQYDGSAGEPNTPVYKGTYCTNRKKLGKAYRQGRTIEAV